VRELLTLFGKTDGSSTTGTCKLSSELFQSPVDYLRIPKGLKLKLWCKRIAGNGETDFIIEFTKDVTVSSPTWTELSREKLASKGELILEKRRPVIVRGITGREAVRISWSQPSAVNSFIEVEVEVSDED